tara:strand:+ start:539 stop:1363 length:825 start_codon:yes stop_codon:yes gene_type:complete
MSENKDNIPRHQLPKGSRTQQELLYDPEVATSSHAEQALTLATMKGTATLCTISAKNEGYPYGSFVTYVIYNGNPIFLISGLAEHTKNLINSSKASLLVAEGGDENPLALGRVTLVGDCTKLPEEERADAKTKFISKHPGAAHYVDFGDFHFYVLEVEEIRYIGGFGRMSWIDRSAWLSALPDPLAPHANDIIAHMNEDHEDAMIICCKELSKATDTSEAVMTGIDRYGFEMSAMTEQGPRPIRLAFENEATTPDEARIEIVALVKQARKSQSE